ncbi:UDP-glucosyltransferase 2-like isoform X2 [Galleria mellonella]|uniref:UDP-glucosyltransferase 2-like isoform X2 n=1 Tax=Galleria mellonella TaxID=7137 RepID=A0A6J3CBI8_GALME|nr:UDP-glucosyltransferase 2-like isoform X2 [Galleria mellonella]
MEFHQVTYVSPFPMKSTNSRFRFIDIRSPTTEADKEKPHLNPVHLKNNPMPLHHILKVGSSHAQQALQHPALQELLQDRYEQFDLVLAEWFYSGLLAPLATVFDCPLVWYFSADVYWQVLQMVHEPSSPIYTAEQRAFSVPAVPFTPPERAYQLWLQLYLSGWIYYFTHYVEKPVYVEVYDRAMNIRGRMLPEYEPLVYNGSLLLINSYPPLGQSMPLPQNVKYIGGHHIDNPIKTLPKDLERVMENARNGVIFFSMGSNVKSKDFPETIKQQLVDVFRQLDQTVIWKFEEKIDDIPRNLHILEWAPQLSILCHPNTKVMITHGELLSLIEATYCGVPIIAIPLFGDQFFNIDLTVARGAGIRVDFTEELPRKIFEAIHEISTNQSYRHNAESASTIFKSRPTPVNTELLHWLRLVIDTRGAAHLRSPVQKLTVTERYCLDLLVSLLLLLWFLSKVVKLIKVYLKSTDMDSDSGKKEQ